MTFTRHQNFSAPPDGQGDWDSDLNANIQIAERGYHFQAVAAESINSGDLLWANSGNLIFKYDGRSADLRGPIGISYKTVNSGDSDHFISRGIISSMDIWSGDIIPGLPVFPSVTSPAFPTNSFSGAWPPIGIALDQWAIAFDPGLVVSELPERITSVTSFAMVVGSTYAFNMDVGREGYSVSLQTLTDSLDAYKIQFHSSSARAAGDLLYETVTTSVDGGASDFDVNTINFIDRGPFAFKGTDVSSLGLIFGQIVVQSAASVGSSDMGITLVVERLK